MGNLEPGTKGYYQRVPLRDKQRAWVAYREAASIDNGIVPLFCSECFSEKGIVPHHDDYSEALGVRGLCRSCHQKHHFSLRDESLDLRPDHAKTIRQARESRGHSVTEAAATVGVSSRTWHTWEKEGASPQSPAVLRSLTQYEKRSRAINERE